MRWENRSDSAERDAPAWLASSSSVHPWAGARAEVPMCDRRADRANPPANRHCLRQLIHVHANDFDEHQLRKFVEHALATGAPVVAFKRRIADELVEVGRQSPKTWPASAA